MVGIAFFMGYFFGALPFAVWVGRMVGVDVTRQGSCNPGATNVLRLAGKKAGYTVFLLDALKGAIPVASMMLWDKEQVLAPVMALLGAIVGHSFSCFLRFKGGKGVATTIGGLLILMPISLGVGACVWGLTFWATRYVSLASVLLAMSLPISAYGLKSPEPYFYLSVFLAAFVVFRHRKNLQRIFAGNESRFLKK